MDHGHQVAELVLNGDNCAQAIAVAFADDQVPVLPLVFVTIGLRGLVHILDAAVKLHVAELICKPSIFSVT